MQFKCFCYRTTKWWSLATWSSWNDFILPQSEKTFFWSFLFPLSDLFVAVKQFFIIISLDQHAKKVVSDSPGLVDFAIGQVNIVLNLPDGQVKFCEKCKLQKKYEINCAHQNVFGASSNDVCSKCYLQLARMASCKIDFLCTLP